MRTNRFVESFYNFITPKPTEHIWTYYFVWMTGIILLYLIQKFLFDGSLEYGVIQPLRTMLFIGTPLVLIGLYSMRKQRFLVEENHRLARVDTLTGLWNRRALQEHLEQRIASRSGAIVLIDIDKYKSINDRFGHSVGDECLKQVSEFASKNLPEGGIVGRWGGDEFLAIINQDDAGTYTAFTNALRRGMPFKTSTNNELSSVTMSCGVARFSETQSIDGLLQLGDQRLYASKANR